MHVTCNPHVCICSFHSQQPTMFALVSAGFISPPNTGILELRRLLIVLTCDFHCSYCATLPSVTCMRVGSVACVSASQAPSQALMAAKVPMAGCYCTAKLNTGLMSTTMLKNHFSVIFCSASMSLRPPRLSVSWNKLQVYTYTLSNGFGKHIDPQPTAPSPTNSTTVK